MLFSMFCVTIPIENPNFKSRCAKCIRKGCRDLRTPSHSLLFRARLFYVTDKCCFIHPLRGGSRSKDADQLPETPAESNHANQDPKGSDDLNEESSTIRYGAVKRPKSSATFTENFHDREYVEANELQRRGLDYEEFSRPLKRTRAVDPDSSEAFSQHHADGPAARPDVGRKTLIRPPPEIGGLFPAGHLATGRKRLALSGDTGSEDGDEGGHGKSSSVARKGLKRLGSAAAMSETAKFEGRGENVLNALMDESSDGPTKPLGGEGEAGGQARTGAAPGFKWDRRGPEREARLGKLMMDSSEYGSEAENKLEQQEASKQGETGEAESLHGSKVSAEDERESANMSEEEENRVEEEREEKEEEGEDEKDDEAEEEDDAEQAAGKDHIKQTKKRRGMQVEDEADESEDENEGEKIRADLRETALGGLSPSTQSRPPMPSRPVAGWPTGPQDERPGGTGGPLADEADGDDSDSDDSDGVELPMELELPPGKVLGQAG